MFRPGPPRDRLELPERFRFGAIEVDVAAVRVRRDGATVALEPKAFDLLLLLAANPGRVVEKEEIFERIWTDTVVTDNALARVVAHLRRELGDSAEEARVIETVRTRGYRFLPEIGGLVAPEPDRGEAVPVAAPRRLFRKWLPAALAAVAVLALLGLWWTSRRPPPRAWTATPVQRTFESGYRGGADLSPDGSQLVYASDKTGDLELFVQQVEGGPEVQITSGGGPKIDPAWSPDGRFIAYRNLATGGLWLVAPTGGAPRQITDFGSQPAWFPDVRRIVFSNPGRPTVGALEWPATYNSTLWSVELASGEVREITERDPEAGGQGTPAVSADGRWIYFSTGRQGGGGGLWRVAAAGGRPERLTPPPKPDWEASSPRFWLDPIPTPDGEAVLAIEAGPVWRIVRLGLAAARPIETVLAQVPAGVANLGASRDGRRLVYTEERGKTSLEEIELGAERTQVGPPRVLSAPATLRVFFPRYSPDGARILFQRFRPGVGIEAVVLERSTGVAQALPLAGELAFFWLGPRKIAVGRPGSGLEFDLETGRRRTTPPLAAAAALLARARPRPVARLAGGHRILFTATDATGAQELFLGDLDSGEGRQLTRFGRSVDYPFVSRDGRWIGFQVAAEIGADNEIWRVALEGGAPERLRSGTGPSWVSAFSPDGEQVVYAAHREGHWHLAIAGIGEAERRLDVPAETVGYLRWPDWSPDGRFIAYERMRHEATLWTLELPPPR